MWRESSALNVFFWKDEVAPRVLQHKFFAKVMEMEFFQQVGVRNDWQAVNSVLLERTLRSRTEESATGRKGDLPSPSKIAVVGEFLKKSSKFPSRYTIWRPPLGGDVGRGKELHECLFCLFFAFHKKLFQGTIFINNSFRDHIHKKTLLGDHIH